MRFSKFFYWVPALFITLMGVHAVQAQPVILSVDQLSVTQLVQALDPREQAFTRSMQADSSQPMGRPPSASLLITFETDSAVLTQQARQQLEVVASALKNERLLRFGFNIEGHADPRGTPLHNMGLSQKRAQSVRSFLIDAQQISESRLLAFGKGDSEPVNQVVPEAPENRRVTIVTRVAASEPALND
jgi:OmpA-OmpF porin, OOP family